MTKPHATGVTTLHGHRVIVIWPIHPADSGVVTTTTVDQVSCATAGRRCAPGAAAQTSRSIP
jgi:hypothetical protein